MVIRQRGPQRRIGTICKLDIDSDLWMMLAPGDNVLRMTADEGNENLTAIVTAPKGVASGV